MYTDQAGKRWYKGNLHTHTTVSDGKYTPEEAIALYRGNGYDFLALTDHWALSAEGETDGLTLLAGCEYNFGKNVREGIFHIICAAAERDPGVTREDTPQACIDKIHAAGGLAILAHPAWSLNTPEQIRPLKGLDGTEMYNSVSGLPRNCRPYSGAICDLMAAEGYFMPLMAADDTHFYIEADKCRSFIMVQAEECTAEALRAAIRRGDFYASQGPHITAERDGRTIRVHTTPVESIVCYTDVVWDPHRAEVGDGITEAEFTLAANVTSARIEATDADGRCAWTGYFVF